MEHTCADCGHVFNEEGSDGPHIQPAVQCPQCHSYRTQPGGIPAEQNDMLHGQMGMPTSTQDDMSGNPLQEGMLGGWKNRDVRDESFGGGTYSRSVISLFETPEFETTELIAPPDLYRHALETEAAHRAGIQIPNGITDNLHAALGNLGAWVENPYENGELRPYSKKYWQVIRPSYMKPGSLQIGVADPTMAEIINHVAQTDDLAPLYEYRGKQSHIKTAGPLMALAPEALAPLIGAGADAGAAAAGTAADAAGAADAAASAGTAEAAGSAAGGSSAGGIGGIMQKVMGLPGVKQIGQLGQIGTGLNMADDLLGGLGGGGGMGGAGMAPIHDPSFYSHTAGSDEDDAHPDSHDEIPKQEDGDYHEQDDGNHHEWQRDISVDHDGGGSLHAPSFDPGGAGMQRFMMLFPLLLQMIQGGQDGSQDPLVQGLHQTLDSEIPGYLDHGDPHAAEQLIMVLSPEKKSEPASEGHEDDHTDENAGGKRESKTASLDGDAAEFLPDFTVTPPALNGIHTASPILLEEIAQLRKGLPAEVQAEIDRMLLHQGPRQTAAYLQQMPRTGTPPTPQQMREADPYWDSYNTPNDPTIGIMARTAEVTWTPEQIQRVQAALVEMGADMDTILSVPTNPVPFADLLAHIQQKDEPPASPADAGFSDQPPMPAQENAPPGATMPVPPMGQAGQMMAAVRRYAADSIAGQCPNCGGHTTELINDDGKSRCHGCNTIFTTEGVADTVHPGQSTASTWNVDEDLRKEADSDDLPSATDDPTPVQGVPIADQQHQRDLREEQDSGHTWLDEDGNPLKVGQEYEMYSSKYDIPDLVRIEAVKPDTIVYTLTGEFGIEHSTELTKQEANIERITFKSTIQDGEFGPEDDESLEDNNDNNSVYTGEPERTDASAPTGLVAASVRASGVVEQTNPKLAWLTKGMRTAGANYTPMEQRALIDEQGVARNADLLSLTGTHYLQDADEDQFLFGY